MDMKAGGRLRSVTDSTQLMVVRQPNESVDLRCGGHPMVSIDLTELPAMDVVSGFDSGTFVGKRYVHESTGLEVLCTKGGSSSLSIGVEPLTVKASKPLPSSD
jgi:hypothetical protein